MKECPEFSINPDLMNFPNVPEHHVCGFCIKFDKCETDKAKIARIEKRVLLRSLSKDPIMICKYEPYFVCDNEGNFLYIIWKQVDYHYCYTCGKHFEKRYPYSSKEFPMCSYDCQHKLGYLVYTCLPNCPFCGSMMNYFDTRTLGNPTCWTWICKECQLEVEVD